MESFTGMERDPMLPQKSDHSIREIYKRKDFLSKRILSSADNQEKVSLLKELQKVEDMLLAYELSIINIKIYCLEKSSQEKPSFIERVCRYFWMFIRVAGF